MIFIPPQEKSEGQFIKPNLPFSSVASASFRQGWHDSFFNQISENVEDVIYDEGATLTPDEANNMYSLPGLEFNEPIRQGLAALKHRRKADEIARQTALQLGTEGLFSLRGAGSLAASIIANNLNPVDFAFNFVPIAGATRYGRAAGIASKAGARGRMAGGLGRKVSRTSMPAFHRMVSAGVDASVGNLILEIPLYWQNQDDQTRHTLGDVATNVAIGGLFGAGLSGMASAIRAAGRKWFASSKSTRAAAIKAAYAEAIMDRPPRAASAIIDADLKNIEAVARERAQVALAEAVRQADAKVPDVEAAFAARIVAEGDAGAINSRDLIEVVSAILPDLEKRGDSRVKIASRLLENAEKGDPTATPNLARLFDVRIDEGSRTIPPLFGETPKTVKSLDDIGVDLPKVREISERLRQERGPEIENQIKREVATERNRMIRESYRNSLRNIQRETVEAKARAAADALDAESASRRPIRQGDEASARASDEAELQSQIDEATRIVESEAPDSLKAAPERVDEEGVQAGVNCMISNAS